MPKFLVRWEMNSCMLPADPEEQGKLFTSLFRMLKEDEKTGVCMNWGMFPEANAGISLSDQSAEELSARLMQYSPYIDFEVKPLLSLDQAMRAFQKAGEEARKK